MSKQKFDEILDFAIEKEKEAVKFYQDLQNHPVFSGTQEFLKELEKAEEGHIRMIQNIKKKDRSELKIPQVQDLKLSHYLIPQDIEQDMSYENILITAMKREERSIRLYSDLKERSADQTLNRLFTKLIAEEKQHKFKFERLYDDEVLTQN